MPRRTRPARHRRSTPAPPSGTVPVQHRVDQDGREPGQRRLLQHQRLGVGAGREGEDLGRAVRGGDHVGGCSPAHDHAGGHLGSGLAQQPGAASAARRRRRPGQAGPRGQRGQHPRERREQQVDALLPVDPADEEQHPVGRRAAPYRRRNAATAAGVVGRAATPVGTRKIRSSAPAARSGRAPPGSAPPPRRSRRAAASCRRPGRRHGVPGAARRHPAAVAASRRTRGRDTSSRRAYSRTPARSAGPGSGTPRRRRAGRCGTSAPAAARAAGRRARRAGPTGPGVCTWITSSASVGERRPGCRRPPRRAAARARRAGRPRHRAPPAAAAAPARSAGRGGAAPR